MGKLAAELVLAEQTQDHDAGLDVLTFSSRPALSHGSCGSNIHWFRQFENPVLVSCGLFVLVIDFLTAVGDPESASLLDDQKVLEGQAPYCRSEGRYLRALFK